MATNRVLREFAPDDLARILALVDEVEHRSGVSPLDDDARTGLHDAPARDLGILVEGDGGALLAYLHLAHHHPAEWSLSLATRTGV